MPKQEAKIEYIRENVKEEVFFFKHDFQSAFQHAQVFVERNKGKFVMKVFVLNENYIGDNLRLGPKWRLESVVGMTNETEQTN